jgi:hypothetical protein
MQSSNSRVRSTATSEVSRSKVASTLHAVREQAAGCRDCDLCERAFVPGRDGKVRIHKTPNRGEVGACRQSWQRPSAMLRAGAERAEVYAGFVRDLEAIAAACDCSSRETRRAWPAAESGTATSC